MFLFRDDSLLIIIITLTLNPLSSIITTIIQNERFRINFTSTLFKSSLALLKVGCVVFGSDDSDEHYECGYDSDEDTLDLWGRL